MKNLKSDILSGFIVFLIALPLSLGIAMASGVPPMAGLLAAIVGGLVVSRLSGSFITINGPAAGLIVVVLSGVEVLGKGNPELGYKSLLLAVLCSGIILTIGGFLNAGTLAESFPASAAHGMLAAIGVIIMSKQIHVAMGVVPTSKEPLGLLAEIPNSIIHMNPEIAIIAAVSIALLVGLPYLKSPWMSRIPAPMIVIAVGVALGHFFDLEHQHKYLFLPEHEYPIGPKFLVTLPSQFLEGITLPNFKAYLIPGFWSVVASLTIIQGLETLLSAAAAERFDPQKRITNLNTDLSAVGFGSAISGLIGGLPIIAEIVRSRANVTNGAQSRWSNFFHGLFMLLFVALAPGLIHQIPLACLASLLIVTGYRLASPSQFKHTWHIGSDQFAIFTVTLIVTLATDLLIGVASGVALKVILHLVRGAPLTGMFKAVIHTTIDNRSTTIMLKNAVVFTNFWAIKRVLDKTPSCHQLTIDLSQAEFVDHTSMEKLRLFAENFNQAGGTAVVCVDNLTPVTDHPLASRRRVA